MKLLPLALTGGNREQLGLIAAEVDAIKMAEIALLADLRFEHLNLSTVEDVVWEFVAQCWLDRSTNHVPGFMSRHQKEPTEVFCYIPVEFLSVDAETEVFGIRLLPVNDTRVPQPGQWFSREKPIGCIAAVKVTGTSSDRMVERAQAAASHALRLLRVALREERQIADKQLRFRLGRTYALGSQASGWRERDDVAYELAFTGGLIDVAAGQPLSIMSAIPTTDIEKKADIALRWMERAWFATEPLVELLYLFFALEALLGDNAEKLKAHRLAFRQAMLSHLVIGAFSNPNETWFLYDKVRSGAVHGESTPTVNSDTVDKFAWVVRNTLNQFLTVAHKQNLTRRARLLEVLDKHQDQPQLVAWLRQNGGDDWTDYLNELESR